MENALKFYSILFWTSFFMSTVRKGHTTWCPGSQRRRCSHVAPPERGGGLRHRQRWQDRATLGLEVQLLDYHAFDRKISTTTLARNYSRIPGCTQMLWGHTSDVSSVAFHPSGLSFATCSEDKTVSQGFLTIQKRHWWLTGNVTGIKANQSISNPSRWDFGTFEETRNSVSTSPRLQIQGKFLYTAFYSIWDLILSKAFSSNSHFWCTHTVSFKLYSTYIPVSRFLSNYSWCSFTSVGVSLSGRILLASSDDSSIHMLVSKQEKS